MPSCYFASALVTRATAVHLRAFAFRFRWRNPSIRRVPKAESRRRPALSSSLEGGFYPYYNPHLLTHGTRKGTPK